VILGAGTLVDFYLRQAFFEERINRGSHPYLLLCSLADCAGFIRRRIRPVLPSGCVNSVAIILPIVGTFFCFFHMEDSGYFPRMAMLIDRLFKKIGLMGAR